MTKILDDLHLCDSTRNTTPRPAYPKHTLLLDSPDRHVLRAEVGVKYFRRSMKGWIRGSRALDWLLSFSQRDWATVFISDVAVTNPLGAALRRKWSKQLVLNPPPEGEKLTVIILAGVRTEMSIGQRLVADQKVPVIAVGNKDTPLGEWNKRVVRVTHAAAGGVTNWRGGVCSYNWEFRGWKATVRRDVTHIIDHGGERPKPCDLAPDFPHLKGGDLIPVSGPKLPVVFHTFATRTNWGCRQLSTKELGLSQDLPLWVLHDDELLSHWLLDFATGEALPLKVLQATMHAFQAVVLAVEDTAPPVALSSERSRFVPDADETTVAGFDIPLPGSWTAAGIVSAKAVKDDNAAAATGLWDQRVLSLFPGMSLLFLCLMRGLLFRRWQANVTHSFLGFLKRTYGASWRALLVAYRRLKGWTADSGTPGIRAHHLGGEGEEVAPDVEPSYSKDIRLSTKMPPSEWMPWFRKLQTGDRLVKRASELHRDVDVGTEALAQVQNSSWWEWAHGSALLFWRWPAGKRRVDARDGMPIFVRDTLPQRLRPQRSPKRTSIRQVAAKVSKVRKRKYIRRGAVKNLTDYFDVPKGLTDIRMVYNGTTSGLNIALWAPSFYMPTSSAAGRLMSFYTWCADLDLGEMFLNFPMDLKIRPFAGVDLTPLASWMGEPIAAPSSLWERWERLFMGMKSSPYNAVCYFYVAEEIARGNPRDPKSALYYDKVTLNLPGMAHWDPSLPNVMKWNSKVGRIAGDIITFVDDLRATGYNKENAWQVARQIAARLQYLGIQEAPRKRRPPSQEPGAWAGCVFIIDEFLIGKTVTEEKWNKARAIIDELFELLASVPDERPMLNHKELERKRGFLVHLSMTFESIVPFLKGIHLTLDSWRDGRDEDGWKMSSKEWSHLLQHRAETSGSDPTDEELDTGNQGAPTEVKAVPRLAEDMKALKCIFGPSEPPVVTLRRWRVAMVVYGFGDASGKGFGSTFDRGAGIAYRIGVWGSDESGESSNWREFTNVVESLEEEAKGDHLTEATVFFFTDNSTVEAALYKGTSSSLKLWRLVVRLRALELKFNIQLQVTHVSGDRMIAEGGDGVSRGSLNEGVMAGLPMLSFVPLHLSPLERSPTLLPWIRGWTHKNLTPLSPGDWFERGQDIVGWTLLEGEVLQRPIIEAGIYGWFPPPAAADVAIQQLRIARIKRQESSHIFVCPRLLTPHWLKLLYKACDVVFTVEPGSPGWPKLMYEPLLIGLCFPYLRSAPWELRGAPKMHALVRQLHSMRKESNMDEGSVLRKFWVQCHGMHSMPERLVPRMLYFRSDNRVSHSRKGPPPTRVRPRKRRRSDDDKVAEEETGSPKIPEGQARG